MQTCQDSKAQGERPAQRSDANEKLLVSTSVELFRQISAQRRALPASPVSLTLTGTQGLGSSKAAAVLPAVAACIPALDRLHIHVQEVEFGYQQDERFDYPVTEMADTLAQLGSALHGGMACVSSLWLTVHPQAGQHLDRQRALANITDEMFARLLRGAAAGSGSHCRQLVLTSAAPCTPTLAAACVLLTKTANFVDVPRRLLMLLALHPRSAAAGCPLAALPRHLLEDIIRLATRVPCGVVIRQKNGSSLRTYTAAELAEMAAAAPVEAP